MEVGKTYIVKKDIFSFKTGEVWSLVDESYQFYYGEHNFTFINEEKQSKSMILHDGSNREMEIYCDLEDYFEE